MNSSPLRPVLAVALTGLLVLSVALAAGPAMAQDGEDPPDPEVPAAYYGSITIDGEPAPTGVDIEAVVNGSVEGTITVQDAGTYGGPTVQDEKLMVEGYAGETVTFYVTGADFERTQADQTVTLQEFDDRELNLTVSTNSSGGGGVVPPGDNGDPVPDPADPVASMSVDPGTTVSVGEEVTLSGADSSVAGGEIASYEWSIDGQSATGASATTSFDAAGSYEVTLTVTSAAGLTATTTQTITVEATADPTDNESDTNDTDAEESEDGEGEDSIPGFGLIAVLVAGAGWLVWSTRR